MSERKSKQYLSNFLLSAAETGRQITTTDIVYYTTSTQMQY